MDDMVVLLRRSPSTDQGTFGVLAFGPHVMHSVELPWRDNARQRSCIPPGSYQCAIVQSPKFGRVYGVANVPGRSHVLIHAANLAGDVDLGWVTQLHGCIAPAERIGSMKIPATTSHQARMQRAGLVSRPALGTLMAWAAGRPFTLEITA